MTLRSRLIMAVNWGLAIWISYRIGAHFGALPDRIPTHFDMQGRPDGHGSKMTLWLLPAVMWFECVLFSVLMRYPHIYNMPRKAEVRALPPERRDIVYEAYNEMMAAILLAMGLFFAALSDAMLKAVKTQILDLSVVSVLVWLCALAGIAVFYILRNMRLVRRMLAATPGTPPTG